MVLVCLARNLYVFTGNNFENQRWFCNFFFTETVESKVSRWLFFAVTPFSENKGLHHFKFLSIEQCIFILDTDHSANAISVPLMIKMEFNAGNNNKMKVPDEKKGK